MNDTTTEARTPAIPIEERFLNLAEINIGEALVRLGNLRQRGGRPGPDMTGAAASLKRAVSALAGTQPDTDMDSRERDELERLRMLRDTLRQWACNYVHDSVETVTMMEEMQAALTRSEPPKARSV